MADTPEKPSYGQPENARPLVRYAVGVEYDGSDFCGWQIQRGVQTIQEHLDAALSQIAAHPVSLSCAGRTDSGVHALCQVAHFDSDAGRPLREWRRGANSHLPDAISVQWAASVPAEFHARYSALARCYQYLILDGTERSSVWRDRATVERQRLQVEAMHEAAQALIGKQDFSSFRAAGCQALNAVRTVHHVQVRRVGIFVILTITANAFLQHMVRNIAGSLLEIGRGRRTVKWLAEVLAMRDRTVAAAAAPANGLYFCGVQYPSVYKLSALSTFPLGLVSVPGQEAAEETKAWQLDPRVISNGGSALAVKGKSS